MINRQNIKKNMLGIILVLILVFLLRPYFGNEFDDKDLNVDNIMGHIETLSSSNFQGRLAGSQGNEKALDYVKDYFQELGIEGAGVDGSYFQPFSVLMPQIDQAPIFQMVDNSGQATKSFEMYEDYSIVLSPNGGGIDFTGQYIVLGPDFLRVDPSLIKDKIVIIERNRITADIVSYIIESGGKGVLSNPYSIAFTRQASIEETKFLDISGKSADGILLGYITTDLYSDLEKSSDSEIRIKINVDYPIVETKNFLAKIDGKSKKEDILIISANLDGLGMGVSDQYFPGASNSASGLSIIMEVARIMKNQDNLPYKTVIFAGWNGQKQQLSGSEFYINSPVYPLDKTTIIHLDVIGNTSQEGLTILSDPVNGRFISEKIVKLADDIGLHLNHRISNGGLLTQFSDKFVPGIMFLDSEKRLDSYEDRYLNVDKKSLEHGSFALLNYIKRDLYRDVKINYLKLHEKVILWLLLVGAVITIVVAKWYAKKPYTKLAGKSLESLYFSRPLLLIRKFYTNIVPYMIAIFMLVVFANIDTDLNAKMINGNLESNSSLWLIFKRSFLYIRGMLDLSAFENDSLVEIIKVIYNASKLSVLLVFSALILSTSIGIFRGMVEAYRSKKSKLGSLATLVFFSIPEVLIVLLVLYLYIIFIKAFPNLKDILPLNDFILPLFTLSIIPTIYVSRMTLIAIEEEMSKDYIKNEKAKGFSRKKIIFVELLPAVVFKIVDVMPTIVTMLFSNMIIVEYLFNYQGILYYLIYLYNRQDVTRFVPLALTLGLIYIVFTKGFQFLAKAINPLKRREVS